MTDSVHPVYPVTVRRRADGAGAGAPAWTAEVPWIPDCAVAGATFDELERGIRALIVERTAVSAPEAELVELQWSVDETEG